MGSVIGDILPLALGVAISPMPIIAIILMLLAPRAGASAAGFLLGWVAGIVVAVVVVTVLAEVAGLAPSGSGSTASAAVKLVLGVLMLLLAAAQWRRRPEPGTDPPPPKWLAAIDSVTPAKAVVLAFALVAANPKNLVMTVSAGVVIGAAKLPVGQIVIVIAVFAVIAACTVAAPVVTYRAAEARARHLLEEMRTWLVAHNAAVMVVLFVVIGVALIGKGIGGL